MKKQFLSLLLLVSTSSVFAGNVTLSVSVNSEPSVGSVLSGLSDKLTVDYLLNTLSSAKNGTVDFVSNNKKTLALLGAATVASYLAYENCPWVNEKVNSLKGKLPSLPKFRKRNNNPE